MKISIPKESVERIMADYGCTEEDAAKAFLDAQDRANEAYRTCLTERFDQRRTGASAMPRIFTPKEIKSHLDKYVIGQKTLFRRIGPELHGGQRTLQDHTRDGGRREVLR
ncbi:MAG: hypothetical protein NWR42_09135 [Desulfobacterales bacterium]|nr:hypothetical protein [Desulfobacterales bacterium]